MRIIATQTGYYESNNIYLEAGTTGVTDDVTGVLVDVLKDGVSVLYPPDPAPSAPPAPQPKEGKK